MLNARRQTSVRTTRPFLRASLSGLAIALLVQAAGTSAALGQSSSKSKKQQQQSHAASTTQTATNSPMTPSSPQPSMASSLAPPAPTNTPKMTLPKGATAHGAKGGGKPEEPKVKIDDNNIVDLHVSDEDLSAVLEMLSIQSQRNIVASKNVQARVTANLYGVTFYEALDAILNVNGYGYIEDGNFIYVYTLDEIAAIEKANKQRVSKAINLNYLSAVDAAEFVKPLLAEGGQIKTNGKMAGFPSLGDVPVGNEEYALTATLVIYDYEENVAEIEALLKQIDTRPAQVLIEATILQTQLNEDNAFGVDFAVVADMSFGDFLTLGGPLLGPNALIGGKSGSDRVPADGGGTAISSNVGNTSGKGGFKVGVVSNDVAVFMRVLDEVTDSTVLSNPKLLALNRQAARVLVGRKVGYLSTTSTDTATTQTVEFLDTGTQLYVRPIVTPDGMIRMELKPQVSEAVIRDIKDATGAAVTVPDEITNEITTNVLVRDGQTIVLGGLFRESTTSTRRQIPGLGDIPLIGHAFRGNEDSTERSEIIFLITPTIVNDTALAEDGKRGAEYVDHARAGAREGTLIWSRDKLTSQLNVEAERLAAEGNTEKALWKAERSLALNHSQPEVVALRERLTGKKSPWPDRSMLNRIIHTEVEKTGKTSAKTQNTDTTQTATAAAPAWVGEEVPTSGVTSVTPTFVGEHGETQGLSDTSTASAQTTETGTMTGSGTGTTTDTEQGHIRGTDQASDATAQATGVNGEEATFTASTNQATTGTTTAAAGTNGTSAEVTGAAGTPGTTETATGATALATTGNGDATGQANGIPTFGLAVAANTQATGEGTGTSTATTEFARLWFGPSGLFGPFWGNFDRFGRTTGVATKASEAQPQTMTQVDETQPQTEK